MSQRSVEIAVGLFVLMGLGAILIIVLKASNLSGLSTTGGYSLNADFEDIGGLKAKAPVKVSGVTVGRVTSIDYDAEALQATVEMAIGDDYRVFSLDSSASIYTAGLLGEQYVSIEPGAEDDMLQDGDEITLTQSALVLERLVGQFLFSKSGD